MCTSTQAPKGAPNPFTEHTNRPWLENCRRRTIRRDAVKLPAAEDTYVHVSELSSEDIADRAARRVIHAKVGLAILL